ncbi:glycosyl hydrolase [Paenibacillus sp. IB182496]|uniref:Glycosyl hydrolase n=1 Tax=Paenibacillus sabuli TaxID=2772509 RepID=A0A927BW68_9BACL|nr:glycoside hydrolase family 76 protein [Paenibacillus sabuli]MBD2846619.1 glycosyl hydrolase [Paenibacillus sabuli]
MTGGAAGWSERAEWLQERLYANFHDRQSGILRQWHPAEAGAPGENFYYWWQAHVIDVWVDGYTRTRDARYLARIRSHAEQLRRINGGTFLHPYYDDMEWLALALLRVYDVTGEACWHDRVLELWADIKAGWNDQMGGGVAWNKHQLDYKNTPANAPAAILAARLHQRFGAPEDLAWAERIYAWNRTHLVDPASGFVWDGINRLGDGAIDKDWTFTYCQGVMIGAGLALHACTGAAGYLAHARQTAEAARQRYVDPRSGLLPDEGIDDTGLFKGILVRYIALLVETGEAPGWEEALLRSGETLWSAGLCRASGLVGPSWADRPDGPVQLSVQLSGIMLFEALARLAQRRHAECGSNTSQG